MGRVTTLSSIAVANVTGPKYCVSFDDPEQVCERQRDTGSRGGTRVRLWHLETCQGGCSWRPEVTGTQPTDAIDPERTPMRKLTSR